MSPKPKKLPATTVARWAREVQGIMSGLEANAPELARANDWIDDGRRGADYSAVRRGGSEGTAPELAALRGREDDHGHAASRLMTLLEGIRRDAYEMQHWMGKLIAANYQDKDVREAAEQIATRSADSKGAGWCSNCTRVVSGSRIDRIRAGRCEACFRWWDRHGRSQERPRELWDGQCAATATLDGVEHECVLPLGHPCDDLGNGHQWESVEVSA